MKLSVFQIAVVRSRCSWEIWLLINLYVFLAGLFLRDRMKTSRLTFTATKKKKKEASRFPSRHIIAAIIPRYVTVSLKLRESSRKKAKGTKKNDAECFFREYQEKNRPVSHRIWMLPLVFLIITETKRVSWRESRKLYNRKIECPQRFIK